MKKKIVSVGLLALCGLLGLGWAVGPKASATVPGVNALVSVDSSGTQANAGSQFPAISGDGRYVVFQSSASNLVSGDTNGVADVFVRDVVGGTTVRVDVSSSGVQANAGGGTPRISYDGRYVVFSSAATNLVASDTNGKDDVFIRDIQLGTTTIVSTSPTGTQGDQLSYYPDVSADGRFVVFESPATNLVSGVSGSGVGDQVYVKDVATGALQALSVTTGGSGGNGSSGVPRISCSGNVVTFTSNASNLVAGDTNGIGDAFVSVLGWSGNKLTNITGASTAASGASSVSCNGNIVGVITGSTTLVSGLPGSTSNLLAYNRLSTAFSVVSVDGSGSYATGGNEGLTLSDDGRYATFWTDTSLLSADGNSRRDVYIRDLRDGTTQLISSNPATGSAVGNSEQAVISADGSNVTFYCLSDSGSSNGAPVSNDTNGYPDIYISQTGF